jgi:cellulose synthase operon protein C
LMSSIGDNHQGRNPMRAGRLRLIVPLVAFCLIIGLVFLLRGPATSADTPAVAEEHLSKGNYREAIAIYDALSKRESLSRTARAGLLRALFTTGEYQRVEDLAGEFLQEAPAEAYLMRGRSRQARGNYAEAEKDYRQALAVPGEVRQEARMRLALLLERTGRLNESRDEFATLYQESREVPGNTGRAAVAAHHLGQYQQANALFREATSANPGDLETWNAWGYLFLEKYDKANAASVFEDALKVNSNHPDSLVGLAETRTETVGAAEELIAKSLAVNPSFEPAHAFKASIAIESEEYEEAARHLEKVLEINPNSLEGRSLKAVLHLARQAPGEAEREIESVLAINPRFGELYQTLAEYSVTQRFYSQAVEYFRKAVELNPALWSAYSGLGINLLRLGQEEEARQVLEISYSNDPFNVWTVNTLRLIDSFEHFETVEVPNFRIKLHKKEAQVLRLYVPGLLQEVYDTLGARYKYRPSGTIYLEMFPDHEDFAVRTLGLPGLGALGVCFGPGMVMDSPSARPKGTFNWGSTLWHEYAHVVTLGMTDHRVPRWLSEGLSVLEEHRARPGWGDSLTIEAVKAMQEEKLLPISDLNQGFQRPRFPGQVQLSYFQAGQVCEFIEKDFGFAKILAMLDGFRSGGKLETVLEQALGIGAEEFDSRFKAFLTSKYRATLEGVKLASAPHPEGAGPITGGFAAVESGQSDDFFTHLRMAQKARAEKQIEKAISHLQKAKRIFPTYDRPDNPYRQLADIHLELGNREAAVAELEELVKVNGSDFEALGQLGRMLKEAGRPDAAIPVLENAIFVYPFDAEIHALLGELAFSGRQFELALREFRAVLALEPADRAAAHFNVGQVLFEMGKPAEARREILAALEIAPSYEPAQELLLKLSN